MSTINVVLEADADGTLHLPLPPELRNAKIRVEAKLEAVEEAEIPPIGSLKGIWMAPDFDEPLEDFRPYME